MMGWPTGYLVAVAIHLSSKQSVCRMTSTTLSRPPDPMQSSPWIATESVDSSAQPRPDFAPDLPLRRITVDEYHGMIECGIFGENDRLELLQGWLVSKMTHSPLHDDTVEDLDELLRSLLPPGWRLRVQSAITTKDSEPEPDLAVVRKERRGRGVRHPGSESIGLVVEVADSSLRYDRTEKALIYAAAGIAEYWIINLREAQIEVCSAPSINTDAPGYVRTEIFQAGQTISLRLDGQEVAIVNVSDLLSRRLAPPQSESDNA